jgi:hypothetical protein
MKTFVTLLRMSIPNKHTRQRAILEFMICVRSKMRIAETTKDTQEIKFWRSVK